MRIRSAATVLVTLGLLAGAILRCSLPPLPPPPQALATKVRTVGAVELSLSGTSLAAIDRAALVASLKDLGVRFIVIRSSADATREYVNEAVELAVLLQSALDADVFVGSYDTGARNGLPIEQLLQNDDKLDTCYPDGPRLDPSAAVIDKIRLCSQDISRKIVQALAKTNASTRIGCFVTHQPELADTLSPEARTKLNLFFEDSASACREAKRLVASSPLISERSGNPDRAGTTLRESLGDAGVDFVIVEDGVQKADAAAPPRAGPYYYGVQSALIDRVPERIVLANVDAFDCEGPGCAKTHPTSTDRFIERVCSARGRVSGIVAHEYIQDLAGRPIEIAASAGTDAGDAATDAQADLDDVDASAQLRKGYLDWRDAGAPCNK